MVMEREQRFSVIKAIKAAVSVSEDFVLVQFGRHFVLEIKTLVRIKDGSLFTPIFIKIQVHWKSYFKCRYFNYFHHKDNVLKRPQIDWKTIT